LEPSLQEGGVTLALDLAANLPPVLFDPGHLRQVLLNLAKNGIEAMGNGGVMTVSSGRQAERIFVQVADTGEGIPAEILKRIFQPFFSTKPRGSGLGLAISQRIMEANHGEIKIDSEPSRGTRVTVLLKTKPGSVSEI
jgi:two-component system sensor histidine kinase HydH